MAQAALFMGPMARKKRVSCHYDPNSYRVISTNAEDIPVARPRATGKSSGPSNLIGQPTQPRPESEHRHNRPNPRNVNFLRQDVRLLNEPVCNVYTASTVDEQHSWWPHRSPTDSLQAPPKPLATTVRKDFQYRGQEVAPNNRFSANPNKTPALGCVPVNFKREPNNKQRFWKEGISYEHQYNCRLDPQYPERSKRHGSFVWSRMQEPDVDKMLKQHSLIADKQNQTAPAQQPEAPNSGKRVDFAASDLPAVAL